MTSTAGRAGQVLYSVVGGLGKVTGQSQAETIADYEADSAELDPIDQLILFCGVAPFIFLDGYQTDCIRVFS